MTTLEFHGLTVRFGSGRHRVTAVDGVDLVVPTGTVVGLVGGSGSGKSTLARAAIGLAPVSAGRVLLGGEDVTRARGRRGGRRRAVQMVFQDPYSSLDPRMPVGSSIEEGLTANRDRVGPVAATRRARAAEVERLLDLVHLDPGLAAARPGALSGGQRQRIALARVLAAAPEVIIADEITSALDVSVQGSILNLVRELRGELGLTMLFISHNLALVRYVSDTVAVMRRGELVEVGPTEQLLGAPEHGYTQELLEAVPRLGDRLPAL
ncbi:ABC transporter ATP-binding protein [Pseudonocardia kunmingensis]|uniref:Peptide/nickel transport system ATP-binding protein n=1 Tax=Pseudonocardia kunmingensis TaxID=630975 RepID=A0A543DRR5_9PSEU|nr:peptide/nickel transport system ATP-binding protein [Pseudonocardia kunmingensis]